MILTQHYLGCLSQASYVIGDETSGRAVVVDPRRDIDVYLDEASAKGLTIERVIETHVHADFVGGHLELANATGAVISYGVGADVAFPVDLLADGQRLSLGEVTLEIRATPGHTPESICIVVFEHPGDEIPHGVLTGDTLFIGDVGRPDLLASGGSGLSADTMARRLYQSLRERLLTLPDETRVYPGHGAGSACGKQLSSATTSTIGEQRRTNYALQTMDEDAFVAIVTEGQPLRPGYFGFDAESNRRLHPLLDTAPPPLLGVDQVLALAEGGAVPVDPREPSAFAAGHLRGAVNVTLLGRFAEWAGDVLSPDRDIVLVGDPDQALEAKVRLGRIGYDRVVGQLDDPAGVLAARPDLHETSSRLTIGQLAELRGLEPELELVDVRSPGETAAGTIAGAREIPLPALTESLSGLNRDSAVVVYCAGGTRSQVAASVMRRAGFVDVSDVLGGFAAWKAAGLPVATGDTTAPASVPEIAPRRASTLIDDGAVLLDVREPDEWQTGHAPGATLLAMGQVQARRDELPRDRRVIVVCRSGGRSAAVTQSLRSWGFDAVNLSGGMCAWAAAGLPTVVPEADLGGLVVHRTRPLNCETSLPALIGGVVMPNARFYVRNHFDMPRLDPTTWRLRVGGLVDHALELSLPDLHQLPSHTMVATLECAGNGRSTFDPPVPGEQWHFGAVSTAEWTGVPLVEVLDRAAPQPDALDVVFAGADRGAAEGGATPITFERSLRLDDIASAGALLAYAMNGDPLPIEHGYPVRLIVPGWYAVASVKWLTSIEVIDTAFEGFFQVERYCLEVEHDGATVRQPVRYQRVRSLIIEPAGDTEVTPGDVAIRGVAWSGLAPIERVEVCIGSGPWQSARMVGEAHAHSWQWWELLTRVEDSHDTVVVRARATDRAGNTQPERPEWNRLGYGGNGIHVITLRVS